MPTNAVHTRGSGVSVVDGVGSRRWPDNSPIQMSCPTKFEVLLSRMRASAGISRPVLHRLFYMSRHVPPGAVEERCCRR